MSSIDQAALSTLRANLSPSAFVSLPGEPKYSIKRWALNAEKPAAIVACPATPEDVAQIIAFAQSRAPYEGQKKLDFVVKGGGHSPAGASSSDGGLVIDLQPNMHSVRVDPEAKLVYVSGGAVWGEVDEETIKHGLASVSGIVSHTGVGKLALGGGYGWLCGQHGLVIDNIVQHTVVTSSSEILTASSSSHPDLYWALRGGGGNFGVVTEFVLQLYDQRPDLYSSVLTFLPIALEAIVLEINAWLKERTPEESGHVVFANGPGGPAVVVMMFYNGPLDEGKQKFERFAKLGPVVDQSQQIPYIQLNQAMNPMAPPGDNYLFQGSFIPITSDGLPVGLMYGLQALWLKFTTEHPEAIKSAFALELYDHKKWSSVPPEATALASRNPTLNVAYILHWTDTSFTSLAGSTSLAVEKEFAQLRDTFFPPELTGHSEYVNYLDEESRTANEEFVYKRYGANAKRLVGVKRRYDAGNVFGRWFTPSQA